MNRFILKIKNSWRSWTMWFNAIGAAILLSWNDILSSFPSVQGYIDDALYKKLMLILIVGNMILRVKTNKDLADKGK